MTNLKSILALKDRIIWGKHKLLINQTILIISLLGVSLCFNFISNTTATKESDTQTAIMNLNDFNPGLNYRLADSLDNEAYASLDIPSLENSIQTTTLSEIIEYPITINSFFEETQNVSGSYNFNAYLSEPFKVIIYGTSEELANFNYDSLSVSVDLTNINNKSIIEAPIIIDYISEVDDIIVLSNIHSITLTNSQIKSIMLDDWKQSLIMPIKNPTIICGWYGYDNHQAIDLKNLNETYTTIYAVADGIVEEVSYDPASGNYVVINHQNGVVTRYGHLRNPSILKEGSKIRAGAIIGTTGMTGIATTPHLHFAMELNNQRIDPTPWLFN